MNCEDITDVLTNSSGGCGYNSLSANVCTSISYDCMGPEYLCHWQVRRSWRVRQCWLSEPEVSGVLRRFTWPPLESVSFSCSWHWLALFFSRTPLLSRGHLLQTGVAHRHILWCLNTCFMSLFPNSIAIAAFWVHFWCILVLRWWRHMNHLADIRRTVHTDKHLRDTSVTIK